MDKVTVNGFSMGNFIHIGEVLPDKDKTNIICCIVEFIIPCGQVQCETNNQGVFSD